MKKLMTCTIILLPLLILAIMLVSGAILSLFTHIYVESVEFSENDALVLVMKDESEPPTYDLGEKINILPLKAPNRNVRYKSDDESLVRVNENGVVTAVFYGETYITVTSVENEAATAKRKVIVTDSSVHALRFTEYEKDMYNGETAQLFTQIFPSGAGPATVVYSSSDDSVLSVSQNGDVVCKGVGEVTVTASLQENPSIKTTANIVCHAQLESLTTETSVKSVVMASRNMQFPKLKPTPSNATFSVEYVSSNESVATVDGNGAITFLKEGSVTVTAKAVDGRGNSDSASVVFTCTDGYYMGDLFGQSEYSFDYDEYVADGKALDIELCKAPLGSFRKIVNVTFDREGILTFDYETEKFSLVKSDETQPLGKVHVTILAQKYSADTAQIVEVSEDVCDVTVTRKTSSLSFKTASGQSDVGGVTINRSSVSFTEITSGEVSSGVGVAALPRNHTDQLRYSVTNGTEFARFDGMVLVFSTEGEATVTVTSGDGSVFADITVHYVKKGDSDKEIKVDGDTPSLSVVLSVSDSGKETGLLNLTPPAGMKASYQSDNDDVLRVDGLRLVPLKGGFANVTVTYTPAGTYSLLAANQCVISVYVDKAVSPADLTFSVNDGYTTSLDKVNFTVTVNAEEGAMEGKTLWIGRRSDNGEQISPDGATNVYSAEIEFPVGASAMTLFAAVRYDSSAENFTNSDGHQCKGEICSSERKVNTTRGNITNGLSVSYGSGEQLLTTDGENNIVFPDLNEKITLDVSVTDPDPQDFELSAEKISFGSHGKFSYTAQADSNSAHIELTATAGGEETVTLRIAGIEYTLKITVELPAHSLEVKYGNTVLDNNETYPTLLESVPLTVNLLRDDGVVSETSISYSVVGGESSTSAVDGKTASITVAITGETVLTIDSALCHYTVTFSSRTMSQLNLAYHVEYSDNGRNIELDPFQLGTKEYDYNLPKTNSLSICIECTDETLLGGFTEKAMNYFSIAFSNAAEHWQYNSNAATAKLVVSISSESGYYTGATVVFSAGDSNATLVFECMEVGRVEFSDGVLSFDNGKSTDVYLGQQQVRVFAKQSYYKDEGDVDYFRIPVKAVKDDVSGEKIGPDAIKWILTRYVDSQAAEVITVQCGNKVVYKGVTYTIERGSDKHSILKKDGEVIAESGRFVSDNRVTWVDVYADENYADIYFGDFGGLTETDVRNDYFGNFGEQDGWSKTPSNANNYDLSGRDFKASPNAYSFLRVEAGNGAEDSKTSAHFNFNVLDGNDVFNVFDAEGYYNKEKVVLQDNLYGPNELDGNPKLAEAENKKLILDSADKLGKSLIYGNGYQVNLQAKTASMATYSESDGITISRAYNTVIKCANPTEEISDKYQKMTFKMAYAYYCDLSYYYKFNPDGNVFYAKNTVFSCIPKAAVQLYYDGLSMYAENVVMTECGTAIQADNAEQQNIKIYYKGSIDILNYFNQPALSKLNSLIGSFFDMVVPGIKEYFEWHGKEMSAIAQLGGNNVDKIYVNVLAFSVSDLSNKTYIWTDDGYKAIEDGGGTLSSGAKIACKNLMFRYYAMTYETMNNDGSARLDNATVEMSGIKFTGTADMDSLFTTERYIRLQCEFKEPDVKNYDHILWHKQNVYRDLSLIDGRKSHIDNLKDSLKNTQWDDGSGVDGNGTPYEPAAQLNAVISQAVIPSKRNYVI